MKFELNTADEIAHALAKRLKLLRLRKKWKRSTLAERSGVTESSLRRFEQTARISLENFLKLMSALGRLDEADALLQPPPIKTIDDIANQNQELPKRGTI